MRKNLLILALSITLIPILNGCSKDDADFKKRCEEAEKIVYEAYLDKDYKRILTLTDSVRKDGLFSEGKACYWMGYAYDRLMRKRMAELYWKTGIAAVENSTDDEDVRVYAGITNRLTGLLTTWTEYEAALKVAIPATERLKSLGRDTTSEYTNMLIYIGCCRSRLGLSDKNTINSLEEAYGAHLNNIKHHPNAISYRDAIVGVINISYNYLEIADYANARVWLERMKQLIDGYEKQPDMRPDYAEKQQARYEIYMARALEGLGRKDEAAEAYRKFCETDFFKTAEGNILASDYLRLAGRWQDAADNFGSMNEMMKAYGTSYSLENIQKMLLKKYEVNMKAGRLDTARAVSISITERLDSAITLSRSAEAREEAAVHQKELEMTAENERYMRQQHITRLAIMAAVILLLFVYIVVRHRVQARLAKALEHAKESDRMKTAFVQHISHEIRTPLNIITGFAQVVSNPDYELSKEDRNRIMADISHNTTEITNFVNELLELSESESQSVYQLDDDVDVPTICQEAIEASETANQGRLALSVSSELPEGYRLKSNAAAIRKILDRLMSNALKFTVNGSVTIRLKSEKGQLKIEVEDTGKGIPHDQQERVFERFYKIDSFVQGMGLGLTVARRSAQLLGGTLTIDPTYTTGCRFVITLPENKHSKLL
ncbi:MAG: HAMP domain-containing histidine kinase [Prevotella ruminicola]|jgi:signal transduction histidine kinase|uniref:histidine kinase n=1 Tax=Xylanibacter ruminicola TaxID=839 RepID=A0A928GJ71_XYLRU|nr:HAMP domain-containing histidine kinase [Xylanibacter ruminicola]